MAAVSWFVVRPKLGSKLNLPVDASRDVRIKALRRHLARGEVEVTTDHPALRLMCEPNDHFSGFAFWKLAQTHLDLVGEAFIVMHRIAGVPTELWLLPPMSVTLPDFALPREQQFFRVQIGNATRDFPAADVLHLKHADPDDPLGRGVGMAYALGDELDIDTNNATPAAVVSIEGLPSGDVPAAKRFKEDLKKEHRGPGNAGNVLVTGGKVSIARLETDLQSTNIVAVRKAAFDFIRMCYRVPPEVIGDMSSTVRADAIAAHTMLAEVVTVPRAELLRTALQKGLVGQFGEEVLLDYESPVPADRDLQFRVMSKFRENFTGNEARALAGHRPRPGLDRPMAPAPGTKLQHKKGNPQ